MVAPEEQGQARRAEDARQAEAGRLELDVEPEQADDHENRRGAGDQAREPLQGGDVQFDDGVAGEAQLLQHGGHVGGGAGGEQRLAVPAGPGGLVGGEGQQAAGRADDLVADLEFQFAAHHFFGQFGVVAGVLRGGADERGDGRDGFFLEALGHFLHAAEGRHHDRERIADDRAGGHVDAFRRQRDDGAGGEGVLFDEGVDGGPGVLDGADDVAGGVQGAAGGVHDQEDGGGVLAFGLGEAAAEHVEQGAFDLAADGHDVDRRVRRGGRRLRAQRRRRNEKRGQREEDGFHAGKLRSGRAGIQYSMFNFQ